MRNWITALRKASFRGVPFHVAEEGLPKTGRRIARHEYSKAETHDTEDMGIVTRDFRVKAYIANDRADADAQALIRACSTKGVATLVLPFFGPQQVRCEGCSPSHSGEKLGYVAFDLDFVAAGGDGAGSSVIQLGDRLAQGALDRLSGAVSDAIAAYVPDPIAGFLPGA